MKEWFSSKELASVAGMPSTTQGINRKARVENWTVRKRSAGRGKALEYNINSLPVDVKNFLIAREERITYVHSVEPFQLWMTAFDQLSEKEKSVVTSWLIRNGIKDFITFISEQKKDN